MCRQITCNTCGKPTWAGCGAHIEQVLAAVPPAQRCPGHAKTAAATTVQTPAWWPFGRKSDGK
jgi:hypothetical protein